MAFDADGTLWSGDVGEDVFDVSTSRDLLRNEALPALRELARAHGLDDDGTPAAVAKRIYEGYRRGDVTELTACEMMTWGYAGYTVDELRRHARAVFEERHLADRARRVLGPVLDWAIREGVRIVVVSASPRIIVTEGLRTAGIAFAEMAGAEPEIADGVLQPRMAGPLPYAGQKRIVGTRLLAGMDWLASFGDSAFDIEMLASARVGVAVCPKPALRARLSELANPVLIE